MDNIVQLPLILSLNIGGRPIGWLPWQEAVTLYVRDEIAWEAGSQRVRIMGGINHITGARSAIELSTIVAIRNARAKYDESVVPTLSNSGLFRRDRMLCLYCGERLSPALLTRDHVIPTSRGGADTWENCASACKPCNQRKANMMPEEAGMALLAVPYAPNSVEALLLQNKRVLADQMSFLMKHVPRRRHFGEPPRL